MEFLIIYDYYYILPDQGQDIEPAPVGILSDFSAKLKPATAP